MYRSNGYIYLYWTGPPSKASSGRWTSRCSITSKNAGGNIFSRLQSIVAIFSFSLATSSIFKILADISRKKSAISTQIEQIRILIKNIQQEYYIFLAKKIIIISNIEYLKLPYEQASPSLYCQFSP